MIESDNLAADADLRDAVIAAALVAAIPQNLDATFAKLDALLGEVDGGLLRRRRRRALVEARRELTTLRHLLVPYFQQAVVTSGV